MHRPERVQPRRERQLLHQVLRLHEAQRHVGRVNAQRAKLTQRLRRGGRGLLRDSSRSELLSTTVKLNGSRKALLLATGTRRLLMARSVVFTSTR